MAKDKRRTNHVTIADDVRYEAEEDLRSWMRVAEIRKDTARRKRVHQLALAKLADAKVVESASRIAGRSKGIR